MRGQSHCRNPTTEGQDEQRSDFKRCPRAGREPAAIRGPGRHRSCRYASLLSELAGRAGDARGAGDARSQPDPCGDTEPEIAPNRQITDQGGHQSAVHPLRQNGDMAAATRTIALGDRRFTRIGLGTNRLTDTEGGSLLPAGGGRRRPRLHRHGSSLHQGRERARDRRGTRTVPRACRGRDEGQLPPRRRERRACGRSSSRASNGSGPRSSTSTTSIGSTRMSRSRRRWAS